MSEHYEDVPDTESENNVYINVKEESGTFLCQTKDRNVKAGSITSLAKLEADGYTRLKQGTISPLKNLAINSATHRSFTKKRILLTVSIIVILVAVISLVLMCAIYFSYKAIGDTLTEEIKDLTDSLAKQQTQISEQNRIMADQRREIIHLKGHDGGTFKTIFLIIEPIFFPTRTIPKTILFTI